MASGDSGKGQQSPRNTGQSSAITKAVRLATVEVSKALQDGEKFIKWEEVSTEICLFTLVWQIGDQSEIFPEPFKSGVSRCGFIGFFSEAQLMVNSISLSSYKVTTVICRESIIF